MKCTLLALLCLQFFNAHGQFVSEIKSLPASKDFKVFQQYLDTAKSNKTVKVSNVLQRDITPSFQEMVILVEEEDIDKNNKRDKTDYYRFSIIAMEKQIAFSDFIKLQVTVVNDNKYPPKQNNKVIDLPLIDSLYTSFLRLYHADLNM